MQYVISPLLFAGTLTEPTTSPVLLPETIFIYVSFLDVALTVIFEAPFEKSTPETFIQSPLLQLTVVLN